MNTLTLPLEPRSFLNSDLRVGNEQFFSMMQSLCTSQIAETIMACKMQHVGGSHVGKVEVSRAALRNSNHACSLTTNPSPPRNHLIPDPPDLDTCKSS